MATEFLLWRVFSQQVYKQLSQLSMGWNHKNHEPEYIFSVYGFIRFVISDSGGRLTL